LRVYEKTEELHRNFAETAGKWKSEDKTEYYFALTIEMK